MIKKQIFSNFLRNLIYLIQNHWLYLLLLLNVSLAGFFLSLYIENNIFLKKIAPVTFYTKNNIVFGSSKSYDFFSSIDKYNIFSIPKKKEAPNTQNQNAQNQKLASIIKDFELKGTVIVGSLKFAVLYHKKRRYESSFKIDQRIFATEATLKDVEKAKVLIAIGKSEQYLEIPKQKNNIIFSKVDKKKPVVAKKSAANKPIAIPSQSDRVIPNVKLSPDKIVTGNPQIDKLLNPTKKPEKDFDFDQPNAIKLGDNNNVTVKKDYFKNALQHLPLMLSQAQAVPHMKNQQFIGYRLARVQQSGIFARLGLRANDIITSVNGQKVDNISQIMRFFSVLQNESEINIGLIRQDTPITLNFSLI